RLLRTDPAGRALAAGLVLEEAHQVQRGILHAVLVRQHDDRGRADEAAILLERAEIEWDVGHRRRQDATGGAAGQIALEAVTVLHAAAELVDQLPRGDAGWRQLDPRVPHAP